MKTVKCSEDGKQAVPGCPWEPLVEFKEGDVIEVHDNLANRLVKLKKAEIILDDPEEDEESENDGDENDGKQSKMPWGNK